MKKFKLMALTVIAALGLSGCDIISISNKKKDEITDNSSNNSSDSSSDSNQNNDNEQQAQGEVLSVAISGAPSAVTDETAPFKLTATVSTKGDVSKEVTWSTSSQAIATVSADGTVTPVLGGGGEVTITATSKADATKKASATFTVYVNPGIASVTITGSYGEVYAHSSVQLTANVESKGTIAKKVNWAVDDASIATVTEEGKVTFKAAGTVTVSATSNADSSKSDSVTFVVKDGGLHPELITEKGFTYQKIWPSTELNTYAGSETISLEDEVNGFYFQEVEAHEAESIFDSSTPSYFLIVAEYSEELVGAAKSALDDAEYFGFSTDDDYRFIDPSQTFQFNVSFVEYSSSSTLMLICAYHTAEIYKSSTNTTDTAWNEKYSEDLQTLGFEIPFVTLGENYDTYVYSDGTVEISDYAADFNKLDGYESILEEAGFTSQSETTLLYSKAEEYQTDWIWAGFTEYGNTIDAWYELKTLSAFPEIPVGAFVTNEIGSKYSVPAFEKEGAEFTYMERPFEDLDGEVVPNSIVGVSGASDEELLAYGASLVSYSDFVKLEDYSCVKTEGVTRFVAVKGKIVVDIYISYVRNATDAEIAALLALTDEEIAAMTDEEYDEYYDNLLTYYMSGTFFVVDYENMQSSDIYIYEYEPGMEDAGLYIFDSKVEITNEETYEVVPIFFEIDETEVTYVSSDPTIATVETIDGHVIVTPVELGTVTITASIADTEYSDSVQVTIKKAVHITETLANLNAWILEQGSETVLALPDIDGAIEYYDDANDEGFYEIYVEGGNYAAYAEKLFDLGYDVELGEDEYGYPQYTVTIDDVQLLIYEYYGDDVCIDVYVAVPSATFDFTEITTTSGEIEPFAFTTDVGTNSNNQAAQHNADKKELRLYIGNTMTITADGCNMYTILINANNCGESKADGTLSCDVGTLTAVDDGFLWEGEANEVTFTVNSGKQVHINSIVINDGSSGGGSTTENETLETILLEISYYVYESESNEFKYDSDDQAYYLVVNWGSTESYTLQTAVEDAITYLASDLTVVSEAPSSFTWQDDGSAGYGATYTTADGSIVCEIGSWEDVDDEDNPIIVVQFCVYED